MRQVRCTHFGYTYCGVSLLWLYLLCGRLLIFGGRDAVGKNKVSGVLPPGVEAEPVHSSYYGYTYHRYTYSTPHPFTTPYLALDPPP